MPTRGAVTTFWPIPAGFDITIFFWNLQGGTIIRLSNSVLYNIIAEVTMRRYKHNW